MWSAGRHFDQSSMGASTKFVPLSLALQCWRSCPMAIVVTHTVSIALAKKTCDLRIALPPYTCIVIWVVLFSGATKYSRFLAVEINLESAQTSKPHKDFYGRLENLKSFDEFLKRRCPESRRKAYYPMSIT